MCKTFVLFYKEVWTVLHIVGTDFLEKVMSLKFGYKALSLAVFSTLTATAAQAAGLDRSGQDVTAFYKMALMPKPFILILMPMLPVKIPQAKIQVILPKLMIFSVMALKQTSTTPLVWVCCTMSHLVQQLSMMVIVILWQIKCNSNNFCPSYQSGYKSTIKR